MDIKSISENKYFVLLIQLLEDEQDEVGQLMKSLIQLPLNQREPYLNAAILKMGQDREDEEIIEVLKFLKNNQIVAAVKEFLKNNK